MLDFETCYYIGLIAVETLGKKWRIFKTAQNNRLMQQIFSVQKLQIFIMKPPYN